MSAKSIRTEKLLRRYLSGDITAREEAELERRASADDGLREAMEGLYAHPEVEHDMAVKRMIGKAGAGSRVVAVSSRSLRITRYAAAAAVLLLLGFVAIWLPGQLSPQGETVAMTEGLQETPEAGSEKVDQAMESEPVSESNPARESVTMDSRELPESELPLETRPPQTSPVEPDRQATAKPAPEPSEPAGPVAGLSGNNVSSEAEAAEPTEELAEEVRVESPPPPAPPIPTTRDARKRQVPSARSEAEADVAFDDVPQYGVDRSAALFSGRIMDDDGQPIANALVRRPGLPLGQRTDSSGVFEIPADATLSEIIVSHPDFLEERVAIEDEAEDVQINLSQEEERRRQADFFGPTAAVTRIEIEPGRKTGYAAPLEGYSELRRRIEAGKPGGIEPGKVKVSFLVSPDGRLSAFKFRGRPSQATMDYIGNALVESSTWQVVKGKEPVRVYLKFRFE